MDKRTITSIERLNIVIGISIAAASLVFWNQDIFVGALLGVTVGCVNFMALRKIGSRILKAETSAKPLFMLLLFGKMFLLIGVVFALMKWVQMSAGAFALGISVFFVSMMIETARIFATSATATESKELSNNG